MTGGEDPAAFQGAGCSPALAAVAAFAPANARALRLFNPCLAADLPEPLASHEIVARAFDGIDPTKVIDAHVHLLGDDRGANGTEGRVRGTGGETGGTGTDDGGRGTVAGNGTSGGTGMDNDGDDGPWIGEQMRSPLRNPLQYARYRVFLNASCVRREDGDASRAFLDRLLSCHRATAPGSRLMLLAFDQVHDADGQARPEASAFHVPNAYARAVAARYPNEIEWAASVHPYRADAVEALDAAVAGRRAGGEVAPERDGDRSCLAEMRPLLPGARPAPHPPAHARREGARGPRHRRRHPGESTQGASCPRVRGPGHRRALCVVRSRGRSRRRSRRSGRAQRRPLREADGRPPATSISSWATSPP